ncbi:MAG: nitrilase-related carbon-nitrogen hydrolase [Crocinitomicaceae bacterium]
MQDLSVTIIQIDQIWEDKKANFSNLENIFSKLESTDLIVLPEMFHTGFSMNVNELAEKWEDSEGLSFLKTWAKNRKNAFYTSLIIEEKGLFRNRGVFVYPDGKVEYYDKRKSFGLGGEDRLYTAGDREKIVEFKDWKINLQICYDLRFPELIRNRLKTNDEPAYDLLIYVANWPEKRIAHWDALLKARAIENQCYVVGVNRVGKDGNELDYSGHSALINALGETLAEPPQGKESISTTILSKNKLVETRNSLPFLKDIG